jgi:hypothetical protein
MGPGGRASNVRTDIIQHPNERRDMVRGLDIANCPDSLFDFFQQPLEA